MESTPMKWADRAMFQAEPHPSYVEGKGVMPEVYLLWMTPDPLGAIGAMTEMYKGNVIRNLRELSDQQRMSALDDVQKTHLKAPLEAVKLHFMIDGVDRAFTHQLVRQRTACYAQESQRFAVVEDLVHNTSLPPTLQDLPADDTRVVLWQEALQGITKGYEALVHAGLPQEDARGLLPHSTATRLNFVTDLRNLSDHACNRLCTQAQFHWRAVFGGIVKSIENFRWDESVADDREWQFEALAASALFRPVCYQLGHCPFKASFDRACKIRGRVDANVAAGIPSEQWSARHDGPRWERIPDVKDWGGPNGPEMVGPIPMGEWMLDPTSARVES